MANCSFYSIFSPFPSVTLQSPKTPNPISFAFHSFKSRAWHTLRASSYEAFQYPQLMESKEILTRFDDSTGFDVGGYLDLDVFSFSFFLEEDYLRI
ncbi:hypothetical protein KFK09_027421 [Dendrobium nobile]|uniref:Uncharacterized protein n=1 Tax=Dendrobium nobile TaxID=94219 RepID=A0A8T3AFY0_DENNO|nr:hypothetical protein KFK09_027421 [Dendrobium nobile]